MSLSSNFPTIKPSLNLDFANTKRLDPRVTFTRSTTGTYYDGVTTAKAEENLLFYSQQFNFAPWATGNFTVTADATTAPDGTTTAESFVPDTTSTANHQLSQSFTVAANAPYVFSIFVKPFGYTKIAFRESVQTGAYATFDLSGSGSVVSTGNVAFVFITNAAITSVAGGWFRINLTVTSSNAVSLGMAVFALNNTYTSGDPYSASVATGNGTDGVYIWGAQLEQRSSVTAYTATTTQPITNYIPVLLTAAANVPRFDHNPTTDESLGLLIEEARTNLCTYSEDIASWPSNTRVTINSNSVVAPSGALTADTIVPTSGYATHYSQSAVMTGTAGNYYTGSVYAKPAGWTRFALEVFIGGNDGAVWFDLSAGTIFASTAGYSGTITAVGNGWYKLTVTSPVAVSSTNGTLVLHPLPASVTTDTTVATGDGFNGVTVWGAQMEAAAFATSYIATTSLAVTRTADAASMTGTNFNSWFNNGEGSLFVEGSWITSSATAPNSYYFAGLSDGTGNNAIWIYNTGGNLGAYMIAAGNGQFFYNFGSVITANSVSKIVSAYKTNDSNAVLNGNAGATDTSCVLPTLDRLTIGSSIGATTQMFGHIRRLAYYPVRLTNAQLQAITS